MRRPVPYVLLADQRTYRCRSWDQLDERLVWAHRSGYTTAKARRTTMDSDRPLIPSEAAALSRQPRRSRLLSAETPVAASARRDLDLCKQAKAAVTSPVALPRIDGSGRSALGVLQLVERPPGGC